MTPNHSSILRSAALQRSLAVTPVRHDATTSGSRRTSFAAALTKVQTQAGPTSIPFREEITAAANKYGIDPALLAAVVKQESNFNPRAQSHVGAKGLTQLMDATARGLGVTDAFAGG